MSYGTPETWKTQVKKVAIFAGLIAGLAALFSPYPKAIAAGLIACYQNGNCTLNSLTLLSGGSVTAPTGNFDVVKAGLVDAGTMVSQGNSSAPTFRGTTSVVTPFVDAGTIAAAGNIISLAAAGTTAFGLVDSARICFNTARTACMEWGGGTNTQTTGTGGFTSLGPLGTQSTFDVWGGAANSNTGANCSGNGSAFCVNDSAGLAVANGSGTTQHILHPTNGLTVGSGGTAISESPRGTATLDFPSTAITTCDDLTITVTGSSATAEVALGVPNASVSAGSLFFAWVSAAGTVTVRHCCTGVDPCDPASGSFSARTFDP